MIGLDGLPPRRRRAGWVAVVLGLPALTALLVTVRGAVTLEATLLLFLLAVVAVAVLGGVAPALVAALAAVLLANWFLTPPYGTWQVDRASAVLALLVFVVVAGLVSVTVELGARDRAVVARRLQVQSEVDRARTALLGAVGHELRTPLAGIKVAVGGLRQDDVRWSEAERRELLATVEDSADRLTDLIDNLLSMSRLEAGALSAAPEPVAVEEVVARAALHGPEVEVRVPEGLPLMLADPGLLELVLVNLVANAVRFAPPDRPPYVAATVLDERVLIHVVDGGPGVAPSDRDRMFQPFQRLSATDSGGVGLGLTIARGLTEAMGGTLTPAETPGGGLTMTVALPAVPGVRA